MQQRSGKNGEFMACNNYPDCKHTANVEKIAVPASKEEFHLTIEQTRSNAMSCAIKSAMLLLNSKEVLDTAFLLQMAKRFEKYFVSGE